jgi:integrase
VLIFIPRYTSNLPTDCLQAYQEHKMQKQLSRVRLTAGRVDTFVCPSTKTQAFLWDKDTPTLAVRATPTGRKTYIFESRLRGGTIRMTIGTLRDWPIEQARLKAQNYKMLVDSGVDPREEERDKETAATAKAKASKVSALTVAEVWAIYIEERRPHWGALHHRDHIDKAKIGGLPSSRRGGGKLPTQPGPLASLMPIALKDLDQKKIESWAAKEGKLRPSSARLAWRLLTVFLTWCSEQPEYATLLPAKNPGKTKKAREALGKAGVKKDVLQKGQLAAWFAAIQQVQNPTISACLQVLLLTGARLNEVLTMRWEDVNTQWKIITINDKIEESRDIPLTPYMEHLITSLPKRNGYVFASARSLDMSTHNIARRKRKAEAKGKEATFGAILETSTKGYISVPNTPHTRACRNAGLDGLTLHGLRRSFKSLTEWLEIPVGVVAQIQGHKPSATAEKHYTIRPLELLRVHHENIEAWILEQAEISFNPKRKVGALRIA